MNVVPSDCGLIQKIKELSQNLGKDIGRQAFINEAIDASKDAAGKLKNATMNYLFSDKPNNSSEEATTPKPELNKPAQETTTLKPESNNPAKNTVTLKPNVKLNDLLFAT